MIQNSKVKGILSWILHIGIALVISLLVVNFVIQRTVVHSCSMEPTLQEGQHLWVEKVSTKLGSVHTGDIITIYAPEVVPEKGHQLIKRVIALENDTVEIKDGNVYVNGKVIKETYIKGDYTLDEGGKYSKLTVPKGHVYVLGDNRSTAIEDSRTLGPIAFEKITGKAIFRTFPFDKFGFLK